MPSAHTPEEIKHHRHHRPQSLNEHVNLTCHFDQDGQVTKTKQKTTTAEQREKAPQIGKKRWQETWILNELYGQNGFDNSIFAGFLFIAFRSFELQIFVRDKKRKKK